MHTNPATTMPDTPPIPPSDADTLIPNSEILRQFVPLDGLSRRSLKYLCGYAKLVRLDIGDVLFERGDEAPFTYYLLRGALRLKDARGDQLVLKAGSERASYAVSNLLPRHYRAMVVSQQALALRIQRDPMEKEIAWGQLSGGDKADESDWKVNLLRTPAFTRLPMANVQQLFEAMEEVPAKAGQIVLREGEPGDYFYLIRSGACRVLRQVNGRIIELGTLAAEDAFGDEALVSDKPRNATIMMKEDGVLMRLSKENFTRLMQAPLLKRVSMGSTQQAIRSGKALLIDVRMEEEFTDNRLPEALNIPLFLLHIKLQSLNKGLKYVLYCDGGGRSEAGAFLMTRKGFDAYVLAEPGKHLSESVDS